MIITSVFMTILINFLLPKISLDESGVEHKQPYSLEAADANAIEEVNLAYENVKEVECLDISKEGCDAWDAAVKRYDERIGKANQIRFLYEIQNKTKIFIFFSI